VAQILDHFESIEMFSKRFFVFRLRHIAVCRCPKYVDTVRCIVRKVRCSPALLPLLPLLAHQLTAASSRGVEIASFAAPPSLPRSFQCGYAGGNPLSNPTSPPPF